MQRKLLLIAAICAGCLFAPAILRAADTPAERATLKGLHAVRVVVDCGAGGGIDGFKAATLEAEISSRLRQADIKLLGADERAQGQPALCLTLLMFADDSGGERIVSYWCELSLVQETRLVRAPAVHIAAPTWQSAGSMASVPAAELNKLHETIRKDVDLFIAAHRAVNVEP